MKSKIHLLAFIAIFSFLFTACKKDGSRNGDEKETDITIQSDDQAKVSSDLDEIDDDINASFESSPALMGKTQALCNATIVIDSTSNPRTVTITFNGLNCIGNRMLNGQVKASMAAGVKWKDAGAQMTITFTNLKITRVSDGKYITVNGTKTITNLNGGRVATLTPGAAVTHTISSSNMRVKFDTSNLERIWSIAKRRIFTLESGSLVIRTGGMHTIGSTTNVMEWGTNRLNQEFVTSTEEVLNMNGNCNFRITAGRVKHQLLGRTVTATFGLDAQGNATTCPGANPYYMKLVWTSPGGQSVTVIRPY